MMTSPPSAAQQQKDEERPDFEILSDVASFALVVGCCLRFLDRFFFFFLESLEFNIYHSVTQDLYRWWREYHQTGLLAGQPAAGNSDLAGGRLWQSSLGASSKGIIS